MALCEHEDCLPSDTRPFGRAFNTIHGCYFHPYKLGWNLNSDPNYHGPVDYIRPIIERREKEVRPGFDEGGKKTKGGQHGKTVAKVGKAKNQKTKR
jgi:hypothetical protein